MITIYGNSICPDCDKAKALAEQYGFDWEFKNVSRKEYMAEFLQRFPGVNKVPQILWHNKPVGGLMEFASEIENTRSYGDGPI